MNESLKNQSQDIKELILALTKLQYAMKPAIFNKINLHLKSRYADFKSCMDACRTPLYENGLAITQYTDTVDGKLCLITMLMHVSGQWLKSSFPIISDKMTSQSIGSAMTYAKRYSLCGMLGIVADEDIGAEDDDGEAAIGRGQPPEKKQTLPKKEDVNITSPDQKINNQQLQKLKYLEASLNKDCKDKVYIWLKKQFLIEDLSDVTVEMFARVCIAFENAVNFLKQQATEEKNNHA